MIDIKALMGDSSDNIPGVSGVGKKTAEDLIQRFGTLDELYASLDSADIKPGVRQKLQNDKDMAYLSYKLGTIDLNVPVDTNAEAYQKDAPNEQEATALLVSLEMFKILEKLHFDDAQKPAVTAQPAEKIPFLTSGLPTREELLVGGGAYFVLAGQTVYFRTPQAVVAADLADAKQKVEFLSLLADCDVPKFVYSSKEVFAFAFQNGAEAQNISMDVTLAAYLLNPNAKDYDLSRLAQEYCPRTASVETDDQTADACANLPLLCEKLAVRLRRAGRPNCYRIWRSRLPRCSPRWERVGVLVDKAGIERFSEMLTGKIDAAQARIYELAGEKFNIHSPKQLGVILFDKLHLPAKKKTKTGYSITNAEVLEDLADEYEIVRRILEYRTLTKLKSTYCDGLLKVIGEDGRIHSSFNQTETRTGRISQRSRTCKISLFDRSLGVKCVGSLWRARGICSWTRTIRRSSLRVLADIADDKTMIDAFNADTDIHTVTASQVFHMPPQMVTPLMRSRAKAVNFGIVYGIGAFSLSKDIGVTRAEADKYIKDYLHHYAGVNRYMSRVVAQAKKDGYVTTRFARRRYLLELASSNAMLRAFGERVARNMPILGTAADIIKIAMIRVYRRLKEENMRAKLILQVHDELIVEAPRGGSAKGGADRLARNGKCM